MAIEIDTLQSRITESNILEQSVNGLKSIIGDLATPLGSPPMTIVDTGNIQYAMREVARDLSNVKLPYLAMQMTGVGDAGEFGYNKQALFNGISVPSNASIVEGGLTLDYKLQHVRADFVIQMLTQSISDVINFTKRWKFRQREAQFQLENEGIEIKAKVILPTELTIPEQDMSDYGNVFLYGTTATLYTFIGEYHKRAKITQVNVNTELYNRVKGIAVPNSITTFTRKRSGITRS